MSARSYLRRLAALDPRASLLAPTPVRLLLLTGQSSFASARLRPEQAAFLRAVAPCGAQVVEAGFPYHPALLAPAEPPGILAASLRNAVQVVWSVGSRTYREIVRRTLQRALDTTAEALLLVTGSCGLEMANRVWPELALPAGLRVRVVALGPACFGRLRLASAELVVIQGAGDGWSRLFYRGPVDARVACGHLDYWTVGAVRNAVAAALRRPEAR